MTIEVYGFPRSNFVRAVRMFLNEKGVEYDYHPVLPHSDEIKAIHPMGQIPGMRDGELTLAETIPIMRYIDATCDGPKLLPDDPRKAAELEQWMSIAATTVDRWIMRHYVAEYAFHKDADGNVVRDDIDKAVKRIPGILKRLSDKIGDGYLAGDDFSAADCILAPMLAALAFFPEGKEFMGQFPKLQAYMEKVAARDSFQATAG